MMKSLISGFWALFLLTVAPGILAQGIPNDGGHLPQMIGRVPSQGNVKDPVTISGKITLRGITDPQEIPVVYVVVYTNGGRVARRQVASNGSYTLIGIARIFSTLVVEVNNEEAASFQIIPTIGDIIYQDATIDLAQVQTFKPKNGVISAKTYYRRSDENQKLFDQADDFYNNKKPDEAIRILKDLLEKDPKDFAAEVQLGNVYFLKGKNDLAEIAYRKALEDNPDFTLAMLNLGRLYLLEKNGEKAIEILTKAVAAEPNSADAQHFLGEAYLFIKKGSKAVAYLNEAIRLNPIGKADIHLRLAALYIGAGLKERAALEYKMFLEKVPKYEEKARLEQYIKENLPK